MESHHIPRKIRYAVVGAGNITQEAVLPAFAHARENSELCAVISGDAAKRAALREKYELERDGDYSELEAVLEQGRIDAVYIATPNSTHRELVLRAAARGVHVLCEKPLALSVAEAEEMAAACAQGGVKLMVAYRLHFEEGTLKALEHAHNGTLGEPLAFASSFSHVVRPGDIRTRAETGGGALFDLGIYCINAARHVFRAEPIAVQATWVEEGGVDVTTSATLRFERNRLAQFTVSNAVTAVSSYRISGTEGDLRVEPAYDYAAGLEHFLTRDEKTKHESFSKRDQFAPELVHFSNSILNGVGPKPSLDEGIADLRVIEAIIEAARTGRIVELAPRPPAHQPSLKQELHKPAVSKQETVHAPSPSLK